MNHYSSLRKRIHKLEKILLDAHAYLQDDKSTNKAYNTGLINGLALARAIILEQKETPFIKIPNENEPIEPIMTEEEKKAIVEQEEDGTL